MSPLGGRALNRIFNCLHDTIQLTHTHLTMHRIHLAFYILKVAGKLSTQANFWFVPRTYLCLRPCTIVPPGHSWLFFLTEANDYRAAASVAY